MAKKKPPLPPELSAFIKDDETTFHCDDGDWELKIESRDDSEFKDELPPRSIMIAENGSGDCLFLKTSPAGKIDSKVFVYWHEEERTETFAKNIKELIAATAKSKAAAAKKSKSSAAPKAKMALKDVEKALYSSNFDKQSAVRREFPKSDFGLEALPFLRRALADDDVENVIFAAECIAQLGPGAATCPAGKAMELIAKPDDDEDDLFKQLTMRGGQIWSYSGYANCYSACLNALVKLEYDPDYLIEFVQMNIGLGSDDLIHSLEALQAVGTPKARDLAKRALDFWLPELNMSEAKKAKALLASIGAKKK